MCCGHFYSCTKRDECEVRSSAQGIQEIGLTSIEVMEMVMKCYKNRSSLRTELRNRQGVHGAVEGPCKPEERARLDLIKDWVHAHGGRLRKKRWLVKAPPSRMTYTGGGMPPIDAIAPEDSEDDQPEGAWQGAACDAENEPPCTASDDAALESGHASGAEETSFTDDDEEEDEESAQLLASMLESVKDDDLRKESFFVKVRLPKFCSHAPWC